MAIGDLAKRMLDRTLPKAEWTHEGHFAAALWLLRYCPELASPEALRGLISAYNEATGTANTDTGGYHHTITIASQRAAAHHLGRAEAEACLHMVLAAIMGSEHGHSDWLLAYWKRETLFSPTARHGWVEPDLSPLPF